MPTLRLLIVVQQQGAAATAGALRNVGTAAQGTNRSLGLLRTSLLGLGAGAGLRALVTAADSFTKVENRVRLASHSTAEFQTNMQGVFNVAQETRQPLDATAQVFSRLAVNTRDLGFSTERTIGLVRSINQAVAVSGATAQEARNGLIQLSQGFASGQLRGEEFRAVAEQLPFLLITIADGLGLQIGQLRALAFEGKLTPEIVAKAIESQAGRIDAAFKTMTPTIEQAGTIFGNSFLQFVGSVNNAAGASRAFGSIVRVLAGNVDQIGTALTSAAIVFGTYQAAVLVAAAANRLFAGSITSIMVRSGILIGVAALTLLIDLLLQYGLTTQKISGESVTGFALIGASIRAAFQTGARVLEIFRSTLEAIRDVVVNFGPTIADLFGASLKGLLGLTKTAFTGVLSAGREAVNALVGVFVGGFAAIAKAFQLVPEVIKGKPLQDAINEVGETFLAFAKQDFIGQVGASFGAFFDNTVAGLETITSIFDGEYKKAQEDAVARARDQRIEQEKLIAAEKLAAELALGKAAVPGLTPGGTTEKSRTAAAAQLLRLEQSLSVARAKQEEPLVSQIRKLQIQQVQAANLAKKAGDQALAYRAVALAQQQIIAIQGKINSLQQTQDTTLAQISVALDTVRRVAPEYADELERAALAALATPGGLAKVNTELGKVRDAARDAADEIDAELLRSSEAFASQLSSSLVAGLRSAAQGEGFDVLALLADQFAAALEESIAGILTDLTAQAQKLFQSLTAENGPLAGLGGNIGKALGAAIGVAGLAIDLFSRDDSANIQNNLVKSAVESTQATRGVVAGPTSIPIFQLGEELETANLGVIAAVDRVAAILLGETTGTEPTSLESEAGEILGRRSASLF